MRYFSVDWVIDEIKALAARGVNLIHIGDDLFVCNKERVKIIAERIIAENLHKNIMYDCSGKTGLIDDEICMVLKSMNVKTLFFGFESGNERSLRYLKCGTTSVAKNKEAVELCRRHGLECWGTVIIGSPGETLEEMEDSIRFVDWAKNHGVTRMNIMILHPFPGTPVWQTALEKGIVSPNMNFDVLKLDSKEVTEGLMVDKAMRPEFIKLRDRAYRRVHSFKWKKFRSLLWSSPWLTFNLALASPGSSIKRMLVPTEP